MARPAAAHLLALAMVAICSCGASKPADQGSPPLVIEKVIPLPDTKGRIDHLAYDASGRRLFVAELGNDTVDTIDLASGARTIRLSGLQHPQGLAWLDGPSELAVADQGGTIRFYKGDKLEPVATLKVGDDADNLRVDPRNGFLIAGYGDGALATIDPATHAVIKQMPLPAHPEGFRLDGNTVWVNLPDNGSIVRGDLASGKVTARWSTGLHRLNFPMAFDAKSQMLAIAYRLPARLALVDPASGFERQVIKTCADSDDLFLAPTAEQISVICGSGEIDVYRTGPSNFAFVASVPSRAGARTGLFVPKENRLYVAARAQADGSAAVMVFRPTS
jgi:DNA-binding beta-propeller fold protein YncE